MILVKKKKKLRDIKNNALTWIYIQDIEKEIILSSNACCAKISII